MTNKYVARLETNLDFYRDGYKRLQDDIAVQCRELLVERVRTHEAKNAAAEAHPYIHLAEDLLALIPELASYVDSEGNWEFEAISRAAEHARNQDALSDFRAVVNERTF